MNRTITNELAVQIASADFRSIPAEVLERIKGAIMDDVGVAFLGYSLFNEGLASYVKKRGGISESTLIGDGTRVPCDQAASVNAEMANTSNFEESGPGVHALSSIAQTSLAIGEREGVSGKELLTAVAMAYELNGRFANSLKEKRPIVHWFPEGYRRHLILNVVFAASKLLRCNEREINEAVGLGWMFNPPNMKFIYLAAKKRWYRSEHNFWTCELGIKAALMAKCGLGGPMNMLDEDGRDLYRLEDLTQSPAPFFYIKSALSLKPWINSYGTMGGIQCAVELVKEFGIKAEDVETIAFKGSATYCDPESLFIQATPTSSFEASASIPWSVANAILGYEAGPDWLSSESLRDGPRKEMAKRVSVENSGDPRVNEVEIATKGGETYSRRIERKDYLGSPVNPMSKSQIADKFARNASPVIGDEQTKRLIGMFNNLEELKDIGELNRLFRPLT